MLYWTELNWSGWQLPVCHTLETDFRSSVFAVDANSFLLELSSFGTRQKIIWTIWRQFCSCFTLDLLGGLIAIIAGLLSWRKILDLGCRSSFLAAICQVSDAMRVEVVWRPRLSSEQQWRLKSVLPFHAISDPFCHGKEMEEKADGWTEFWNLKVYSGTGSCNCLNTSDYTSNHSNSWWHVCCNQPSFTGLWHKQIQHQEQSLSCTLCQDCISSWPCENSQVQAEGLNFLSS